MEEGARHAEQEFEDVIGAVDDKKLSARCRELLASYRKVFVAAPPERRGRVYIPESGPNPTYAGEDRRDAEWSARQVKHAGKCQATVHSVLDRVNQLERRLIRRPQASQSKGFCDARPLLSVLCPYELGRI
jgi:hypothetical protein